MTLDDAAQSVAAHEGKVKALKNKETFSTMTMPSLRPFVLGDFTGLRKAISTPIASAHAEARQRVLDHIKKSLRGATEAESFLETGKRILPADGKCPFCGQDIVPAANLLNDYEKYFDASFAAIKKDVSERVRKFGQWSPSSQLREWQVGWAQAVASREKWIGFIPSLSALPDVGADIGKVIEKSSDLHATCMREFEKKVLSLEVQPDLTPLMEIEKILDTVKTQTDDCLHVCKTISDQISAFRQGLQTGNLGDAAKELIRLRAIAESLGPQEISWRKNYRDAEAHVRAEEKMRLNAEKAMDAYCAKTYSVFQKDVNKVLEDFGLRYNVDGLEPRSTQQSSQVSASMSLFVDGCSVSTAKRQTTEACFKNTLSEGEKSALAFAFFLAHLKQIGDLSDLIVLIDDPLSSFDDGRREATANRLAQLAKDCRQLIVLTHRKDFVGLLYGQPGFDGRFLELSQDEKQGACLEPLDVKDSLRLDHEKRVTALVEFFEKGTMPSGDSVMGLIRRVLEFVLRIKYCRRLVADRELTAYLNRLGPLKILDQEVETELRYLNGRSQGGCHAESSQDPIHSLTTPEMQQLVKKTLDVVEKI